ncbi:metallophosphoesterase [Yinghuangia aomiensis]
MRPWQTILLWPDTHIPDHDRHAVKNLLLFVKDRRPDLLVHLGDLNNFNGPSRWSKGTADEFLCDVAEERDNTLAFLEELRAVYDGPVYAHAGNHDERVADGIRLY